MIEKPYAPACERNAEAIYQVLQQHLPSTAHILEVGSGTGQHAVTFAQQQSHWLWQCSDRAEQLPGIGAWLEELPAERLPAPMALDLLNDAWPSIQFDAVFSANTLHIMPWQGCLTLFQNISSILKPGGKLLIYGPFNYKGQYTSDSNAQFDEWLKQGAEHQAIRDFEAVAGLATAAGLELLQDHSMPANNRLLCWQKNA
ncbi:MAG: DUF938 domain-containing protein [Oceanococcus sp.]